ncbi:MAG: LytR/AlgR family response regulator transcription factor [Candidatus Binatia bacterium]
MSVKVMIVDDEPLARERLRTLLAEEDAVELVGECADGSEAVEAIRSLAPDIVFLDIQMPGRDGFRVLEAIDAERAPAVIFVTAYDRFALQAFEVDAVDYLLKPFDRERFRAALTRAKARVARPDADQRRLVGELISQLRAGVGSPRRLAIKAEGRVLFFDAGEIEWIEGDDNYAIVHVGSATHRTRETLTALERRLPAESFLRVSRSAIVNVERIREMHPMFHGDQVLILDDGSRVGVSRGQRARLATLLGRAE